MFGWYRPALVPTVFQLLRSSSNTWLGSFCTVHTGTIGALPVCLLAAVYIPSTTVARIPTWLGSYCTVGSYRYACYRTYSLYSNRWLRSSTVLCHTWQAYGTVPVPHTVFISCSLPGPVLYFVSQSYCSLAYCTVATTRPPGHREIPLYRTVAAIKRGMIILGVEE